MNCVVCKEPMVTYELQKVEIDHCLNCDGIWLDAGELEILLEEADEVQAFLAQFRDASAEKSSRKCPICLKKMEQVALGSGKKVQIDRCRNHHGIWFDRGELREVIEIFDANQNNKVLELLRGVFNK